MNSANLSIVGPHEPIPVQRSEADTLISVIERIARDPSVDLARVKEVMAMGREIREREAELAAESAFNAAMAEVQTKMTRVAADAKNSSTHSRYATYAAMDRALRPLYAPAGFALTFNEEDGAPADHIRVVCYVTHTAPGAPRSHTRKYRTDMPADGKGAKGGDVMTKTHAHGSAQTYAQRYLLKMIWNVAIGDDPDDDDGRAAGDTTERAPYQPPPGSITQEQADQLRDALLDKGASSKAFLQWVRTTNPAVDRIEAIPAELFDACVTAISKFRKA